VIRRIARRAIVPVALIAGAVAVVSAIALLVGSSPLRAIALGLYAVGAGMAVFGFALGSRNLLARPTDPAVPSDEDEDIAARSEAKEAAVLLIVLGLLLLAGGAAIDPRARLI
jgi:hypothetical protein